ncbi:MAG TPA: DUF4118 domain-containing protein [Sphingomicrobium sp.]|nr:DUF4118 domain-containing protein [Sphingomicrobium sp.]
MDKVSKLLLAPPAIGIRALLYGIVLILVPTAIRQILDSFLAGHLSFLIYVPFVIMAAILLRWTYAAAVALASWAVANVLFLEPRYQFTLDRVEEVSFVVFALSGALLIALVEAVRRIVENSLRPARPDTSFTTPVVFSSERGQAWASWYGSHSWVRLGPEDEVAECMQDFLAQRAVAERLHRKARPEKVGNP